MQRRLIDFRFVEKLTYVRWRLYLELGYTFLITRMRCECTQNEFFNFRVIK